MLMTCAGVDSRSTPLLYKMIDPVCGPSLGQAVGQATVLLCSGLFDFLLKAPLVPIYFSKSARAALQMKGIATDTQHHAPGDTQHHAPGDKQTS